jgi:hypothetical protein
MNIEQKKVVKTQAEVMEERRQEEEAAEKKKKEEELKKGGKAGDTKMDGKEEAKGNGEAKCRCPPNEKCLLCLGVTKNDYKDVEAHCKCGPG